MNKNNNKNPSTRGFQVVIRTFEQNNRFSKSYRDFQNVTTYTKFEMPTVGAENLWYASGMCDYVTTSSHSYRHRKLA